MHAKQACDQKQRLLTEVHSAIQEIMKIHNAEVEALLTGKLQGFDAFGERLRLVRELKGTLMDRLRDHMRDHGC